jgi:signal transduction histidine kinase
MRNIVQQTEDFEKATDLGIGLAGIRERVNELGGILQILPEELGALLTVSIPIWQKQGSIGSLEEHSNKDGSAD